MTFELNAGTLLLKGTGFLRAWRMFALLPRHRTTRGRIARLDGLNDHLLAGIGIVRNELKSASYLRSQSWDWK